MSRSPAIPEEVEQYNPGLMIRQFRYAASQEHGSPSAGLIHSLSCTPRVYTTGLQTHLLQDIIHHSPRESPQITVPDLSDAGTSDTQRTTLLSPDSASAFQVGREASFHYPCSGQVNTAFQYTPADAFGQAECQSEEQENLESTGSDGDQDCNGVGSTKVERLAEKPKMKRFRLTHAQTRYLMGEFARQAHPDANQRERLSRDIPGLSPRQVQVWFQNRRAKLKRLSTDDQERMVWSRVLPDDFDFTHTLPSAYGAQRPSREPVASLSNICSTDGSGTPTLTLRQEHQVFCPTNKSPGGSASGSFSLSPVPSFNEGLYDGLQYSTSTYSGTDSPTIAPQLREEFRRPNSFSSRLNSEGQNDTFQQGGVNQLNAKSLTRPTKPSDITFADSPYGYGETPSRSSPAPLKDQCIDRRVSPLVSPTQISPIYKQSSPQYSPAAASAGHPCYSACYTGNVDIHPSQSGPLGRLAQLGQFPRPLDRTVNSFQPTASSNSYPFLQDNMEYVLGQQRLYTEPNV